ncbi:MAG TPA: hypothetical protein PLO43_00740 [Chlamydiales bacterium]|nr:hypothetical protein [Chlamydiales bacterium]HPE84692.1 hypothetical protein [Chlamydiales bacterium]
MLAIICFGLLFSEMHTDLNAGQHNFNWDVISTKNQSWHFSLISDEEGRPPEMDIDVDDLPLYTEI